MSHAPVLNSERHLTPAEVEIVDRRRRRGQLLLTIGFQAGIITTLVGVLWVGQDLTHSPGWVHPMFYWACITGTISIVCLLAGISLRRGFHEFTSY
jgi:apolipoprotein N-acyltransferase